MTQTDRANLEIKTDLIPKKINHFLQNKINKSTALVLCGCCLFFASGILNFTDEFLKGWSTARPFLGYLLFGFTVACLIPIAFGIKTTVTLAFADASRKLMKQASKWLLCYALAVLINIIVMGWPLIASIVAFTIVIARILGFYYLTIAFKKIKYLTDLKVGGFLYPIYGVFYIVIAALGGVASIVNDEVITNLIFVSNGIIESSLIVLISIKIAYDIWMIRDFKVKGKIKEDSIQKIYEKQRNSRVKEEL